MFSMLPKYSDIKDDPKIKEFAKKSGSVRYFLKYMKMEEEKYLKSPLVERTNFLTVDQFIESYVPAQILEIQAPSPKKEEEKEQKEEDPKAKDSEGKEQYKLDFYTSDNIPDADFEACFSLVELQSADYAKSAWGWSPAKKRKEMQLPDIRFLILRKVSKDAEDGEGEVLGFTSFMVTYEDGYEVLYIYEIHLSPAVQGRGFGKQLILKTEDIGRRVGLEKAMLTVFKSNTTALGLYNHVGYSVDPFSPAPKRLRNGKVKEAAYWIMSKPLRDTETEASNDDDEKEEEDDDDDDDEHNG